MTNPNLQASIVSFLTEKYPQVSIDMTTPITNFVVEPTHGPLQFYIDTFVALLEDGLNLVMPDSVFDDLVLSAPTGLPLTLGQAMPYLVQMISTDSVESVDVEVADASSSEVVVDHVAEFADTQIEFPKFPTLDLVIEEPVSTEPVSSQPASAWPFPIDLPAPEVPEVQVQPEDGEVVSSSATTTGRISSAQAWPFAIHSDPVHVLSNPDEAVSTNTYVVATENSSQEAEVNSDSVEQLINEHAARLAYHYAFKYDVEAVLNVLDAIFIDLDSSEKKSKKIVKKSLKALRDEVQAPSRDRNSLAVPLFDEDVIEFNTFAFEAAYKYSLKYDLDAVLEVLEAIFEDVELSKKKSKKIVKKALKELR